ncbi:hypothetical protein SAMN04487996_107260 [Dyadobacter soli]|uniref:Glycosyl-4,4'-diaponeurosporenoate acyltransferase n=1 Tax=Dyadobacter soli TaxID=659014 RepID=A0A1G7GI51_9BACT|nr:hypothetical protein [Dyadobacter soli]SDE87699.1 hypothetical protein SAMN04487996_107260 [Dyadobacter soli]
MLLKWIKILLIVCLAPVTMGLMILYLDITSASFSIAFNFALMFWFAIVDAQFKPSLNSSYFDTLPFEKDGKFYRMLGVEWYQAVLVKSGWEKLRQKQTPVRKSLHDIRAYERATRVTEMGHLVVGAIVLVLTTYVLIAYSIRDALWLIFTNLFLNIYPVLLQRYIRPRFRRMIERFEKAAVSSNAVS